MIGFVMNDALVYNGVKDSFIDFVIKSSGATLVLLKEGIIKEIDNLIPIDTTPAESAEEFIKFLETIDNGNKKTSDALHIHTDKDI